MRRRCTAHVPAGCGWPVVGRCCSGCGTTGPGRRGRCGPRWTRPGRGRADRGAAGGATRCIALAADEEMRPPVALLAHAVDEPGRSAFWPLPSSPRSGWRSAGPWPTASRSASSTCPPRTRWPGGAEEAAAEPGGRPRSSARRPRRRHRARTRSWPRGVAERGCPGRSARRARRSRRVRRPRAVVGGRRRAPGRRAGTSFAPFAALGGGHGGAAGGVRGTAGTTGIWCARRTCGSSCGPRSKEFGDDAWPSCAGPGTCPRCGEKTDRRRRPGPAEGAAQGQGRDDLGAVDAPPAGPGAAATARASTRPAGTGICSARPTGPWSAG